MRRIVFTLLLCAPGLALAHGGGLNAEGCHNNRKTGDYHCHGAKAKAPAPARARSAYAPAAAPRAGATTHYANCDAARAAGAAPVRVGEPGYASHLDRDNDGVGCE